MGWEQRGGRSYFYRKVREGRRVRSKYVGSGVLGQICAANDRDEKQSRIAQREAINAMRQAEDAIDQHLSDEERVLKVITDSMLYAAGYRKHKGQWRKKRHEKKEIIARENT
jgi:hypothetical protein